MTPSDWICPIHGGYFSAQPICPLCYSAPRLNSRDRCDRALEAFVLTTFTGLLTGAVIAALLVVYGYF